MIDEAKAAAATIDSCMYSPTNQAKQKNNQNRPRIDEDSGDESGLCRSKFNGYAILSEQLNDRLPE